MHPNRRRHVLIEDSSLQVAVVLSNARDTPDRTLHHIYVCICSARHHITNKLPTRPNIEFSDETCTETEIRDEK